jgi:hypothetical protein
MRPAEQQAFNVIALKSTLMVDALSCNQSESYDAFMTAFQPHILDEQHVMDGYFRRVGGLSGQAEEDQYVTLLANTQSAASIAQGAHFCHGAATLFTQILAFKSAGNVDAFVAANPLPAPIATSSCGTIEHNAHRHHVTDVLTVASAQ